MFDHGTGLDVLEGYGINLELKDFDKQFHSLSETPVIFNDLPMETTEDQEALNNLLYTRYSDSGLEPNPHCLCRHLRGEDKVGQLCSKCNTIVEVVTEKAIESTVWLRAPTGAKAFIHPGFYMMMFNQMKNKSQPDYNRFDFMLISRYKKHKGLSKEDTNGFEYQYKAAGFKQGLNFFIDNFDEIMEWLIERRFLAHVASSGSDQRIGLGGKQGVLKRQNEFREFLKLNRHKFFPQYLPLPSNILLVQEKTDMGLYADIPIIKGISNAVTTIKSLKSEVVKKMDLNVAQDRTVKAVSQISESYYNFLKDVAGIKEGWWRKHVFGTRAHFTFRAVIGSESEAHKYNEISIPWALAITVLRYHLMNKLAKEPFMLGENDIKLLLDESLTQYNDTIDGLFNELMEEAKETDGIWCILQRNPSLSRLSAQLLKIGSIKKDPTDFTISVPVLILTGYNADFDGDELNGCLVLDKFTFQHLKRLSPYLGVMDLNRVGKVSKDLKMPAPMVSMLSRWANQSRQVTRVR